MKEKKAEWREDTRWGVQGTAPCDEFRKRNIGSQLVGLG